MKPRVVLSLVERGWQAAREWSLHQRPPQTAVIHLIKGVLDKEVRTLIRPVPHVKLVAMPRKVFWPVAFALFLWYTIPGRLQAVLVDNDRSRRRLGRWVKWLPIPVTMVR
jgi:hypothetical protein